jgi:head-tail adaptor
MSKNRAPLPAGQRDQVVTIEQAPLETPGGGFPIEDWTTLVSGMPASKTNLSGSEQFRAAQMSAAVDTRWEINYRMDMDPDVIDVPKTRRLVHNGRVHDIVEASQIGRRNAIELVTLAKAG